MRSSVKLPLRMVFCALKNAPPATSETEEHVKAAISLLHSRWLEAVGATVEPGTQIEINPLFAVDQKELESRVNRGTTFNQPTYLK